jgi:hypothetical protein
VDRTPIGSDYSFSAQAPRREDSQHGYFGDGGYNFDRSAQEAFAYGSGEFLDRSGGRPRAWAGEEPLAEYGEAQPDVDDGIEEAEQEELAPAPSQPPESLTLSSRKDPTTGEWDIAPPPPPKPRAPSVLPRGKSAQPAKPYKESDVPRSLPDLRTFIAKLTRENPGYNQAIYRKGDGDPKPRSVRLNTIAKMKSAGLL